MCTYWNCHVIKYVYYAFVSPMKTSSILYVVYDRLSKLRKGLLTYVYKEDANYN